MNNKIYDPQSHDSILYEALTPDKLELIIMPTERCNFRCTYCYEDFKIGKMKPEIVSAIKSLISERAKDISILRLMWFGGEPLLGYDIVKDIMQHANEVVSASEGQIDLISTMTTNGYLLDEQKLIDLSNLRLYGYQISLDGEEKEHNNTRVRVDGKGTFSKVWGNIVKFNKMRLSGVIDFGFITIRLHISPENIESCISLSDRINNELDPRFVRVFIKDLGYYGGKNDGKFKIFNSKTEAYKSAYSSIEMRLVPYMTHDLNPIPVCYAGKANSFVVRADGRLGKCTVALSSSINHVGRIEAGGNLNIDNARLSPWLKGLSTMDKDHLSCPITKMF